MATMSEHGGLGSQYLVISNAGTLDGKSRICGIESAWSTAGRRWRHTGQCLRRVECSRRCRSIDPAVWAACTPALGYTITEEAIRTEYESMERPEFQRARLCQWTVQHDEPLISLERWSELQDDTSSIESNLVSRSTLRPTVTSLHRSRWQERRRQVARGSGRLPGRYVVGSARLKELVEQHRPLAVVVDALSASLVPELSESLNLTQLPPPNTRQRSPTCWSRCRAAAWSILMTTNWSRLWRRPLARSATVAWRGRGAVPQSRSTHCCHHPRTVVGGEPGTHHRCGTWTRSSRSCRQSGQAHRLQRMIPTPRERSCSSEGQHRAPSLA